MAKTTKQETGLARTSGEPTGLESFFGEVDLTQRPDFIAEGDRSGSEDIGANDVRLPRLSIAQGLSPQLTPGDGSYIDGLKMFDLFNDFTGEVYGKGPIYFIPVRRDVRFIEFRPRSEGGGVVDMNVPRDDERATKWGTDPVTGKPVPPVATQFTEFVVLVLQSGGETEPAVLSIKGTNKFNRRAVTDLNGYILMHSSKGSKSVPIYGVIYSLASRAEKNDNGTFGVPSIKQVGYIPNNDTGRALFERARAYADSLTGKTIVVDREPGDEDVVDAE